MLKFIIIIFRCDDELRKGKYFEFMGNNSREEVKIKYRGGFWVSLCCLIMFIMGSFLVLVFNSER